MRGEQAPEINLEFMNQLIDEKAAAKFLGFSPRALQNWRFRGGGPLYVKISERSCVRYRRRDLIEWIEGHLKPNTSQESAAA